MSKKTTRFVLALVIMTLVFAPIVNASSNRLLSMGSRGSDVRALQQRLNSLGYNCGKVDGIFGKRTYNAVKAFQQKNGLVVDGMVGRNTRNKLYSSNNKPSKGGTSIPPITSLLRRGSRGSQVRTLQNRLNQLGYNAGKADGIFGSRTYNAVKKFQRAKGLSVDGIVGKNTINKLYPKTNTKPSNPSNPAKPTKPKTPQHEPPVNNVPITSTLSWGSRGPQVRILQERLNQLGYNAGKADGIFGRRTYDAVRKFQRTKGLAVDGIAGKNTINKLYPPKHDSGLDDYVPFEVKGSLKGKIVIIDPGHGGKDPGASRNGYKESTFTLDMAKRLRDMLEKAGAEVIMTRASDVNLTLQERANVANKKVLDEEIKRIEKEIQEIENKIGNLNVETTDLQKTEDSLIKQYDENNIKVATLNKEIEDLNNDTIDLEEKLVNDDLEAETEHDDEDIVVEETPEENNELKSKETEEELKILQRNILAESSEVDERLSKITNQLSDIESNRENLKNKLEELKDELKEVKDLKANVSKYTGGNRKKPANENLVKIFERSKNYENIIFISIHVNSTGVQVQTSSSGVQVYYRPNIVDETRNQKPEERYYNDYNSNDRKEFAKSLNEEIQAKSVFSKKTSNLYGKNNFAVLREQNIASALVEVGFINNPNDLALLRRQQTREDMAAGMYNGIRKYFATKE